MKGRRRITSPTCLLRRSIPWCGNFVIRLKPHGISSAEMASERSVVGRSCLRRRGREPHYDVLPTFARTLTCKLDRTVDDASRVAHPEEAPRQILADAIN